MPRWLALSPGEILEPLGVIRRLWDSLAYSIFDWLESSIKGASAARSIIIKFSLVRKRAVTYTLKFKSG